MLAISSVESSIGFLSEVTLQDTDRYVASICLRLNSLSADRGMYCTVNRKALAWPVCVG